MGHPMRFALDDSGGVVVFGQYGPCCEQLIWTLLEPNPEKSYLRRRLEYRCPGYAGSG
jgi:hypothetical protein